MNVKKVIEAFKTLRDGCDSVCECNSCPIRKTCDNMSMYNLSVFADEYARGIEDGCRSR